MSAPLSVVPANWVAEGLRLSHSVRSAMFDVGDWWNNPPDGVDRLVVVQSDAWRDGGGLTHGTCRVAGSVANRWPVLSRDNTLTFKHYKIVAPLPDEKAIPLLQWCLDAPEPRTTNELAARVKKLSRVSREVELADRIEEASQSLGVQVYGVIYADPPWRFEPYSRESGMDRAADNHYPTMSGSDIMALEVPAADDCVLFLWATAPMLGYAMCVMDAWGFVYKTHFIWVKDRIGTGYWSRNCHEVLLVGTRGDVPAPAPGDQYASAIEAAVRLHSEKPPIFAEMIEALFPQTAKLEMFARSPRPGWDVWGAEAECAESG